LTTFSSLPFPFPLGIEIDASRSRSRRAQKSSRSKEISFLSFFLVAVRHGPPSLARESGRTRLYGQGRGPPFFLSFLPPPALSAPLLFSKCGKAGRPHRILHHERSLSTVLFSFLSSLHTFTSPNSAITLLIVHPF